jgi:hypothetical protein
MMTSYTVYKTYVIVGDYNFLTTEEGQTGYSADWKLVSRAEDPLEEEQIDYNDGNWHSWNGGECPVNSESEVQYTTKAGSTDGSGQLVRHLRWSKNVESSDIVAFRVSKVYIPEVITGSEEELWFVKDNKHQGYLKLTQTPCDNIWDEVIHVKVVV